MTMDLRVIYNGNRLNGQSKRVKRDLRGKVNTKSKEGPSWKGQINIRDLWVVYNENHGLISGLISHIILKRILKAYAYRCEIGNDIYCF